MLYADFDELVSYKGMKLNRVHSSTPSHVLSTGAQHSPFRGQGLEFDSVRQYVPGDDIRNIDWRVTARTGSPHLKIFQEERQRHLLLCIDTNTGMRFGTRGTFKSVQAARIASLLGWQGINHQDKVSACLFGDVSGGIEFFTPKQISFLQLLKRLSQPNSEKYHTPIAEAFNRLGHAVPTGSLIYFISDFMDMEVQEEVLSRLRQRCTVIFIAVNDPSDKALPPVGRLGVCSEEQKLVVNTDSLSGRQAYASQWEENRKNLYQKTKQFKIPLIELTTQDDIKKELWKALNLLSRKR